MRLWPFKRSHENPSHPLTSSALLSVLGGQESFSSVSVDATTAPRFIAVYRAWSLVAGSIGAMPLRAFQDLRAVRSRLLDAPHRSMTPMELWELVTVHLLAWGNAYLAIERDGLGAPAFLDPIHPARVQVKLAEVTDANPEGRVFEVQRPGGRKVTLTPFDLLHIPALGLDGLVGLSPVGVARQAIGVGLAQEEFTGRMYGAGLLSSWLLSSQDPLTEQEAQKLKERWQERASGVHKAHDVIVADSGISISKLSMDPEDAQFIQSRVFSVGEIARLYGIPEPMLGLTEKSTSFGAGLAEMNAWFATYTLTPWARRIERRLSRLLPRGQRAEFLMDGLLRGTAEDRWTVYEIANGIGALTIDEIRELENRPPLTASQKDELKPPAPPPPPPPPAEDPEEITDD